MSDTPRTDAEGKRLIALWDSWPRRQEGWLKHSQEIERELNATRAALSGRTVSCSNCNEAARTIQDLRECCDKQAEMLASQAKENAAMRDAVTKTREALETGLLAWQMWANHWRTSPAYGNGQTENHPTQQAEIDKIKAAIATLDAFK